MAPRKTYGPRKPRSNKGMPRKKMLKTSNIIIVGPGGNAHVHTAAPRKAVKNMYGNTHVGGRSIFTTRKVRSNKGVKRGPRHFPRNTGLFA